MSKDEAVAPASSAASLPEPAVAVGQDLTRQQDTAGALLRQARQSQGVDIDTLAALLKVPVHKLEALEQNRFDVLTDPVFARALAASVCRILKLDPAPVLQRLPGITAFKVTSQNRGINTPFRPRTGRHVAPMWMHISRPAMLVGVALLLGALVLIFLPTIQQVMARYRQQGQGTVTPPEVSESGTSVTTTVTTQVPDNRDAGDGAAAPGTASAAPAESAAFVSTPAAAPASSPASAMPLLNFSAKNDSRVKVTDATGVVLLNRVVRAGESVVVSGALPLAAVVSRADAVQVQVRGQSFDLANVSRNNVARFEVK